MTTKPTLGRSSDTQLSASSVRVSASTGPSLAAWPTYGNQLPARVLYSASTRSASIGPIVKPYMGRRLVQQCRFIFAGEEGGGGGIRRDHAGVCRLSLSHCLSLVCNSASLSPYAHANALVTGAPVHRVAQIDKCRGIGGRAEIE